MAVMEAEPESELLDPTSARDFQLDELRVSDIVGSAAQLNGSLARTGGSAEPFAWMEPGPSVEPRSRTRLQLSVEGTWGGTRLTAPVEVYDLPEGSLLRAVFYTLTIAIGR